MDELAGKRLVILGLARQGRALAQFAASSGAKVVISDLRSPVQLEDSIAQLDGLGIEYVFGEHPISLLEGTDILALSGGVPTDLPLVMAASKQGIMISNDSQEFIRRTPATCIGITGSAGKTTTTALTGKMGEAAGRKTWIGGNIGRPLIAELQAMNPGDLVVQELSSFQLEVWHHSPSIAAVLNITPNHLDRHKTMSAYSSAKANVLRFQEANDIAVLSADDPGALALAPSVRGRLRLFSTQHEVDDGAFVRNEEVWLRNKFKEETAVCSLKTVRLRGKHNLLNVTAAVTLADSVDIPVEAMAEAIHTFDGVEHRLELVATVNGVQYVNDSIATAPERAVAAIESYEEPVILLAGGRDKDMVWEHWAECVSKRAKHVFLFGDLAKMLSDHLASACSEHQGSTRHTQASTLAQAVEMAAKTAEPGDVVLLAPGGTSFDNYADFAARGDHFRELVQGIVEAHSEVLMRKST